MDHTKKSIKVWVYALLIGSLALAAVFSVTGTALAQDTQPTATPQSGESIQPTATPQSDESIQPTATAQSGSQSGQVPVTGESEFAYRDIVGLHQLDKNRDYTQYDEEDQGQAECGQSYTVAPGEYWSLIVVNCDVPLDSLLAANPQVRDQNYLFAGELLAIPEGGFSEIYAPSTNLPYVFAPGAFAKANVPVTGGSEGSQGTQPPASGSAGSGSGSVPVTGVDALSRVTIRMLTRAEKNRDYTQYDEQQQGQEECGSEYVVARGESMSLIVVNCDVPLDRLMAANPEMTDPNILFAGQVLSIPEGSFKEITAPTTGLPFVAIPGWAGVIVSDESGSQSLQPTEQATEVEPTVEPTVETPVGTPVGTPAATLEPTPTGGSLPTETVVPNP
jgi:LysM repeat protein